MTTTTAELKLHALAYAHRIRITEDRWKHLAHTDLAGWMPKQRVILYAPGLHYRDRICSIAHELGHAVLGHPAIECPRMEAKADLWAANLLITSEAWEAAETMFDGDLGAIADELDVTRQLATVWRNHHLSMKEAS